MDLTTILFY